MLSAEVILIIGLVGVLIFHVLNMLFKIDIEIIVLFSGIMGIFIFFNIFTIIETNHENISFGVMLMNTLFYFVLFLGVHIGLLYLTRYYFRR